MSAVLRRVLARDSIVSSLAGNSGRRCIRTRYPALQKRCQSVQTTPPTSPLTPTTSTSTPPPPPPPPSTPPTRSTLSRIFGATALFALATTTGLIMSVAPASDTINGFMQPPTNRETLSMFTPSTPSATAINERIISNPLAESLRQNPNYTESRPHMKIPSDMRAHNLTAGTLLGDDKIAVPPLTFANTKAELPCLVQISHLGSALCGHPGVVHGGLLATLLDEGLARACFPALPNKVGVTASLNMTYKKPCLAGSFVVLRAETVKVEGRKAWVKGWIEVLGDGVEEGEHLVEAEALFIEPRGAKNMALLHSSDD